MLYKNAEKYYDPTAGKAISKVMKEYRNAEREKWARLFEIKHRPKVYVVSRYAGDVVANTAAAIRFCRYVITQQRIPVASHLLYPQMLNDGDPKERELGLLFGLALMLICDEVWCFGSPPSSGMQQEIHEAKRLNKRVRYFTKDMEEIK